MKQEHKEEFHVSGDELLSFIKKVIHEGNATKIIIKHDSGHSLVEIPLTVGAVAAIVAPVLTAVGAMAALLTKCTIVVVRQEQKS
ncbi:MAG TPA: DUF4342 domain-containing protein [Terriglobia bacterium]|jgi:hypothetical protein|nr:DUF4342 domain-containing protein [Terriglobia bacterium]